MRRRLHIVHEELKDIINAEANSIATATPYKAKYSDAFRAALEFLVSTPGLLALRARQVAAAKTRALRASRRRVCI